LSNFLRTGQLIAAPAASAARKAYPRKSGLPLLLGHVQPFPCCSAVSPPPSAGCANWQDHSAGRGSMVAPAPAASLLGTRKAGNVETPRRAPALVSGRPCAGDGIGPILAPAPTLLRLSWRRVYDRPPPLTGLKLTLMIAPFRNKRAHFGHSDKKVGVFNCLPGVCYCLP
jgi:hypothetical protein